MQICCICTAKCSNTQGVYLGSGSSTTGPRHRRMAGIGLRVGLGTVERDTVGAGAEHCTRHVCRPVPQLHHNREDTFEIHTLSSTVGWAKNASHSSCSEGYGEGHPSTDFLKGSPLILLLLYWRRPSCTCAMLEEPLLLVVGL